MTDEPARPPQQVVSDNFALDIKHSDGQTEVTIQQTWRIDGNVPTGQIYRAVGGLTTTTQTRLTKMAQQNALPPPQPPTAPETDPSSQGS